jgi:hypothetical protein
MILQNSPKVVQENKKPALVEDMQLLDEEE